MKNKTAAGLLALFLGVFGVHRFYLGQTGLGIFYIFLMFIFGISAILGLIDAIVLLTMDQEQFDRKYNKAYLDREYQYGRNYETVRPRQKYIDHRKQYPPPARRRPHPPIKKKNPFKISGIQKYKDYDFEGAIEDFKKALSANSKDAAVHFNIACAYSITEQPDKAFYHISQAVENGFVDFDKIQEHDALAYVRIQDEFETFVKNGYKLASSKSPAAPPAADKPSKSDDLSGDLLEQIKKLGELRDKGFLTEEEFVHQKKRLLG